MANGTKTQIEISLITQSQSFLYKMQPQVDKIMNGIVCTIALIFAPSIFGASVSALMFTLLIIIVNVALVIYFTNLEDLKVYD